MKTTNEKEILIARMEKLKSEMIQIKNENKVIIEDESKIYSEDKNKVNLELLLRQNEILKLHNLIKDEKNNQDLDLNEIKRLINEKGLKSQVDDILKKSKSEISSDRSISIDCSACITDCTECVTNCTECLYCDTNCVSGCTTCITCISDEVTGNLPV